MSPRRLWLEFPATKLFCSYMKICVELTGLPNRVDEMEQEMHPTRWDHTTQNNHGLKTDFASTLPHRVRSLVSSYFLIKFIMNQACFWNEFITQRKKNHYESEPPLSVSKSRIPRPRCHIAPALDNRHSHLGLECRSTVRLGSRGDWGAARDRMGN